MKVIASLSILAAFLGAYPGADTAQVPLLNGQQAANHLITAVEFPIGMEEQIRNPAPVKIDELAWLAGEWTGSMGKNGETSIAERWSPPKGGAMLATSQTVSDGKMVAFEFIRIVERQGSLIYIVQPNGGAPTEFELVELKAKRVVFENPRHDYPQRIVYELSKPGALVASISLVNGEKLMKFEFKSNR